MTAAQGIAERRRAAEGPDRAILASILDPATTLAIWRRTLSQDTGRAAEAVCKTDFNYAGAVSPFNDADRDRCRADIAAEAGDAVDLIADDLIALAHLFSDVRNVASVRIRLETVADDGCRRFHFDNVAMRLVVTYRGRGTQWVPAEHTTAAHALQTDYQGPLNRLGTGDVAIFRGGKSAVAGMTLHRSPPLKAGEATRLVGVVDC